MTVRSHVVVGDRHNPGRAIAAAAAELEVLLRAVAQRLGVDVDEVSDVRVQDDLMGSWV